MTDTPGTSDRRMPRRRRGGCLLWLLAAWIWFGLVIALSDAAVNAPNDPTTRMLFGVVILAPVAAIGWALLKRLR